MLFQVVGDGMSRIIRDTQRHGSTDGVGSLRGGCGGHRGSRGAYHSEVEILDFIDDHLRLAVAAAVRRIVKDPLLAGGAVFCSLVER